MKNKIAHILLAVMLTMGLLATADTASARCWMTNGHWSHGYWYGGHRVCNGAGYGHCRWVGGYRGPHGYWHNRHRVCN